MCKNKKWTRQLVKRRFEEAIYTLKRLEMPHLKPKGYFNTWPEIKRTVLEILQGDKGELKLGPPSPRAIDRMDETFGWICWVDDREARHVIWLRAANVPWKLIQEKRGYGRTHGWELQKAALDNIAGILNHSNDYKKRP